jgi:energy-coupling factor transporter ATP-binding protein EcfA2
LEKKEGEKGVTYYYLKLKDCLVPKTEVLEIISEGEFNAVAIAAFLAEISLSPTKSGVVFDDPVSSLDHLIREKIAEQLVEIAKDRQVIVFTHDLFFLVTLIEIAERKKSMYMTNLVMKEPSGTGVCHRGPRGSLEDHKTNQESLQPPRYS